VRFKALIVVVTKIPVFCDTTPEDLAASIIRVYAIQDPSKKTYINKMACKQIVNISHCT
jgi:hypothetical protein